jgi:signal transduction histidine kinase
VYAPERAVTMADPFKRGAAMVDRVKRSHLMFPAAVLAALALIGIDEFSYLRSRTALDGVSQLNAQTLDVQRLLRLAVDAETGQRGYLLTGRQDYLEVYQQAVRDIPGQLQAVHQRAAANPALVPLVPQIDEAFAQKQAELAETIELYRAGRRQEALNLVQIGSGKARMDEIRAQIERIRQIQQGATAAAYGDVYGTLLAGRIGITLLVLLSLLALRLYQRQTERLHGREFELREALQAERRRLQLEADLRTAELSDLSRHLQSAREDERQRLARELHDELGALLTTAKLDTARIKSRAGLLSPEIAERLTHLNETLNSGIALKRRIIEDLWPTSLANLGLVAALEALGKDFELRHGVCIKLSLKAVVLGAESQLTAYRMVQEALTNVAKHAKASTVEVALDVRDGLVEISVADDGVGFDSKLRKASVHGLIGMQHRVSSEGGTLTIKTAPGAGTSLKATWPLDKSA